MQTYTACRNTNKSNDIIIIYVVLSNQRYFFAEYLTKEINISSTCMQQHTDTNVGANEGIYTSIEVEYV